MDRRNFCLGSIAMAAQSGRRLGGSGPSILRHHGSFTAKLKAEFEDDGRHLKVLDRFGYMDASGGKWEVPAGATIDGASIPKIFWSIIGGPFEGKYRNASVVHDWYCDVRIRPWRLVHRMFFEAMLTSGVDMFTARLLYFGVRAGGPRWDDQAIANSRLLTGGRVNIGSVGGNCIVSPPPEDMFVLPGASIVGAFPSLCGARDLDPSRSGSLRPPIEDQEALKALAERVSKSNLTLSQIDKLADTGGQQWPK